LLEEFTSASREARDPVGRLAAALDVGRFERIDVTARAKDRLLEGFVLDRAFGDPADGAVEHVIGARDVRVAVRAEVKRAAGDAGLRVCAVRTALLAQLAVEEGVAKIVREHEQRGRVGVRVADGLEDADVEGDGDGCSPRLRGALERLQPYRLARVAIAR